jgi:sucrose-6-phosphate hydrolase SacC (GH32 family)
MLLWVPGQGYVFLRSQDLIKWEQVNAQPNWYECPEFIPFRSPTTGEELWVLYGNYQSKKDFISFNSAYQLGRFDGKTFTPVTEPRRAHQGPNYYAALIFTNEPKNRPIMMGWAWGGTFHGEPFNQCATVPLLLSLRAIDRKDILCFEPALEVNALRGEPLIKLARISAAQATTKISALGPDKPVDITFKLRSSAKTPVTLRTGNFSFSYDPVKRTLTRGQSETTLHPENDLEVRFLVDTSMVESFWNNGEAAYAASLPSVRKGPLLEIEGDATLEDLVVYPMADIWKTAPRPSEPK